MHSLRWQVLGNSVVVLVVLGLFGLGVGVLVPPLGAVLVLGAVPAAVLWYFFSFRFLRGMMQGRLRNRPPLTDEQFVERFYPDLGADRDTVVAARSIIARHFREVGGDRLRPPDRLEDVLRLVPEPRLRFEALVHDLVDELGIDRDDLAGACRQTVDEVITSARGLAARRRPDADPAPGG